MSNLTKIPIQEYREHLKELGLSEEQIEITLKQVYKGKLYSKNKQLF